MLGDDIETCFPTAITTVQISRGAIQKSKYLKKYHVMSELIKRYFLDLFLNPGMLWVRFAMYFMLSLMIGLLFFGLGNKTSYTSIQSRTSVLFYSVSFYIFMVVAVLPFRVHDKAVASKEVFNSYYHPLAHHFASTLASLLGVLILAFTTTVIMVPIGKVQCPIQVLSGHAAISQLCRGLGSDGDASRLKLHHRNRRPCRTVWILHAAHGLHVGSVRVSNLVALGIFRSVSHVHMAIVHVHRVFGS